MWDGFIIPQSCDEYVCVCRWHIVMPPIVEGSIQIMAKAGSGVAMFTMGTYI